MGEAEKAEAPRAMVPHGTERAGECENKMCLFLPVHPQSKITTTRNTNSHAKVGQESGKDGLTPDNLEKETPKEPPLDFPSHTPPHTHKLSGGHA